MGDLKEVFTPLEIGEKTYNIRFDLNLLESLEDEFGSIGKMGQAIGTAKGMKKVVAMAVNQQISYHNEDCGANEPLVTEQWVGRHILRSDTLRITQTLGKALSLGLPEPNEETAPNSTAPEK